MKQILSYLRNYFRDEWNPWFFAATGVFLACCFAVNYGLNAERLALHRLPHPFQQCVFYVFFYGLPSVITLGLYAITTKKKHFLRQPQFYFLTPFAFAVLAVYVSLHNVPAYAVRYAPSLFSGIPQEYHWYIARYASNLLPGLGVVVPLFVYWYVQDGKSSRFYGFSSSQINLKTYFGILALLFPIVVAASFGSDFQSTYPRFKFGLPSGATGWEKASLIGVFELCYGVDFLFVELLFRGFFVMAFARSLGSGAILPMVVVYALLHFQKPMGEAIGSVVGGLVLGVISYRTKSIYGGIILHLGVAYSMELAGTLQWLLR